MRYLGFFLDPSLSFREHIRIYSTKACSTTGALRMLGNSARGVDPTSKRKLYLSNVLPVLLYGAQLWWHPQWKGRKGIGRMLQRAQGRAARWITGCFRTTPLGSMDLLAGLIPVQIQVDRYMTRAGLRARTLHDGHPTRALLPAAWTTATSQASWTCRSWERCTTTDDGGYSDGRGSSVYTS